MATRNAARLDELADVARDVQATSPSAYITRYAEGVEDVLRHLSGSAPMTQSLRSLFEADGAEGEV